MRTHEMFLWKKYWYFLVEKHLVKSFVHVSFCRDYDLVPIAAEDYGDMTHSYKVVAAARKNDLRMTLFNLKSKLVKAHLCIYCFQEYLAPIYD